MFWCLFSTTISVSELYTAWTSASDGVFYKNRALLVLNSRALHPPPRTHTCNGMSKIHTRMQVTLNHDNPFFDDSYAVNSANLGPYGVKVVVWMWHA